MPIKLQVIETVIAFSLLVGIVVVLKQRGLFSREDGVRYSNLMTQLILPAVIFLQLASNPVSERQFLAVVAMFLAGCASLFMSWVAGKIMNLDSPKLGALMITSAFGSSSLLGYSMVAFVFPNNPQAMEDAVLISELGVGLPIFTLCPAIAMHFGSSKDKPQAGQVLVNYLKSPIFIAVVAGLLASPLHLTVNHPFLAPIVEALKMAEGALTFMACLILGIQLNFKAVKNLFGLVLVSAFIQMVMQPYLAAFLATVFHLSIEQHQVLVLISLMPSAVLGTVFATRFECDGETSAALVFANILLSIVFIPLIFGLIG